MWNLLDRYAGLVSVGQQAYVGVVGDAMFVMAQLWDIDPFSTTDGPKRASAPPARSCSRHRRHRVTTSQISLVHLAKSEVHEAGADACHVAHRTGGGASLRQSTMQRIYREMMTAINLFAIDPSIVGAAGRELGGLWSERVWQFYDLVEKR